MSSHTTHFYLDIDTAVPSAAGLYGLQNVISGAKSRGLLKGPSSGSDTSERLLLIVDDFFYQKEYPTDASVTSGLPRPLFVPAGETSKSMVTVEAIWKWLVKNNAQKSDRVLIMGGGTVLDTGAFAASTFQRGLNFSLIPTTLLAMVDASIGGKNGVNYLSNKNYIGTIRLPHFVAVEFGFLNTLSKSQISEGWMEMVKHGLVHDATHWKELCAFETLPEPTALIPLIQRSIEIKQSVVDEDLVESSARKKLNFGHTVAHALESLAQEANILLTHGAAVGIGMVFSLRLSSEISPSQEISMALDGARHRIQRWLEEAVDAEVIRWAKQCDPEHVWHRLQGDKKNRSGRVLEVILLDLGAADWNHPLELRDFLAIWKSAMT